MTASSAYAAPVQKYDRTTIVLHWTLAILLAGNGVLAMMIDNWPREQRPPIVNLHAVIGVIVLLLTVWRIANRVKRPAPPLPAGATSWAEKATKAGQGLLYLGTLLIPLSGFGAMFVRGRGIDFGLFQIAAPMARQDKSVIGPVTEIHELLFWGTAILVAGHVAFALWHQVSLKDRLLERMKF